MQHTSDAGPVRLLQIFQTSDDLSLDIERYSQLIEAAFLNSEAGILHLSQITCRQWNIKEPRNECFLLVFIFTFLFSFMNIISCLKLQTIHKLQLLDYSVVALQCRTSRHSQ